MKLGIQWSENKTTKTFEFLSLRVEKLTIAVLMVAFWGGTSRAGSTMLSRSSSIRKQICAALSTPVTNVQTPEEDEEANDGVGHKGKPTDLQILRYGIFRIDYKNKNKNKQ